MQSWWEFQASLLIACLSMRRAFLESCEWRMRISASLYQLFVMRYRNAAQISSSCREFDCSESVTLRAAVHRKKPAWSPSGAKCPVWRCRGAPIRECCCNIGERSKSRVLRMRSAGGCLAAIRSSSRCVRIWVRWCFLAAGAKRRKLTAREELRMEKCAILAEQNFLFNDFFYNSDESANINSCCVNFQICVYLCTGRTELQNIDFCNSTNSLKFLHYSIR